MKARSCNSIHLNLKRHQKVKNLQSLFPLHPLHYAHSSTCSLIYTPTHLPAIHLSVHQSIHLPLHPPIHSSPKQLLNEHLLCAGEEPETQYCCHGVYILWRSQVIIRKVGVKYDGGDGRSHRNMKQEVHPSLTCEIEMLVLTMVVLFAASSKRKKRNSCWPVSFLRAEPTPFSTLGPNPQLRTTT